MSEQTIVRSCAGHDKGLLYLVLSQEEDRLVLADGKLRKLARPKRKNQKHVEFLPDSTLQAVSGKLQKQLTDAGIRRVLAEARMLCSEAENDQGGK